MEEQFDAKLTRLRKQANLTNQRLASLAKVPASLISGLQNRNRRVGEIQARRIAQALNLQDQFGEEFVIEAIDTCTKKVLMAAREYPSQLLNLLAIQLKEAGIEADAIVGYSVKCTSEAKIVSLDLTEGRVAALETRLISI